MIDFQSSAIATNANYRPCHSPSPGGEGRDEGELNYRGYQSAQIRILVLAASVFVRVHPWLKPLFARLTQFSTQTNQFKGFQGLSKRFKAIQRVWRKIFFSPLGNQVSRPTPPINSNQETRLPPHAKKQTKSRPIPAKK